MASCQEDQSLRTSTRRSQSKKKPTFWKNLVEKDEPPRHFSTKKKPADSKSSSSQKKKQKSKKPKIEPLLVGTNDCYDDEEEYGSQSLPDTEIDTNVEGRLRKLSLNLGDYIYREPVIEVELEKDILLPSTPPPKCSEVVSLSEYEPPILTWPFVPKLSEDSSLVSSNFVQPTHWMIDWDCYNCSKPPKMPKSSLGLVDLDLSDPCMPERPCLLCRMNRHSNTVPCYEQRHRWNVFELLNNPMAFNHF